MATLQFDCPRCHAPSDEQFYGPCTSCRDQLRAAMVREGPEVEVVREYEPKMNVVPNQVATKD
jgi:hypothetical protein